MFAQAQERNTAAIASLEQNVGAIGKDIDFVAARVAETARRSEDLNRDRFAQIEARLAAMKERFGTHAARTPAPAADLSGDVIGLRTSLNDLAATHTGAVAAMTRRLDRIEVMVGISTDMVSSVADPAARQAAPQGGEEGGTRFPCRRARSRGAKRRTPGARPSVQRQAGEPAGRAAPVQTAGLTPATIRAAETLSCRERVFAMHEAAGRFFGEQPMRSMPLLISLGLAFAAAPALAQGSAPVKPEMYESCPGLVARNRLPVIPAAFRLAALKEGEVRINYIGHSTFLIESPKLVRIATDFNDYVKPPILPDIVTMNRAHSTHFTDRPDPGIKFVLRGWKEDGKPAGHDVQVQDVRVRSVATNIRDYYGGGGTQRHGNSIFIFEVANLCIAHLGHLHHTLNQQQLNEIGRVDVVLAPVDGGATLDLDGMVEVLTALKAPLVIPMHFFSTYTLNRFTERLSKDWDIQMAEVPSVVVSKHTLPTKPKLLVLPGRAF